MGGIMQTMKFNARDLLRIAAAASIMTMVSLSCADAAPANDDAEAQARETWRESIVRTDVPDEGCFYASYPSNAWLKMACTEAPNHPFIPRRGAISDTVGNGADYAAKVSGLMSRSVGSFPTVTGVKNETGQLGTNDYSLQLNSNFMSTAACNGHPGCLAWEQFVYASGYGVAFMQYWLINYGTCPSGWNTYSPDCYKNSAAVSVPDEAITALHSLKLSGKAVARGKDTLVFTAGTIAYSTTGKDSVVDLATAWQESEFNIIGDGDGSEAAFNTGSSIKVRIAVTDGSTSAPTCVSNAGTTGETNNLNLQSCSAAGGTTPHILFVESN
jgi:hypothetical protein